MDREREHEALNRRKWDSRAETYDKKRFDYFRLMQRMAIRLVELKPGLHFLDIGCGTGWAVRYVAGRLGDRGRFYGLDISPRMIETAAARSVGCDNVHFLVGNAELLPLDSNIFDCVLCTNSFHHYLNPARALAEMRRVLKDGGRVYIVDLTAEGPFMRFIDGRVRKKEREHVRFYSTREYRSMFEAARLSHVGSRIITFPLKMHIAEKQSGRQQSQMEGAKL
jgi:ubiquinone/menaquinone biosynthesis C-methylase UbiE